MVYVLIVLAAIWRGKRTRMRVGIGKPLGKRH